MLQSDNTGNLLGVASSAGGDRLMRRLQHHAQRIGADRIAARLAAVVGPIVLFPLLIVALDHVLAGGLPRWLMIVVGPAWGLVGVLAIVRAWRAARADQPGSLFIARLLERRAAVAHNRLVNALLVCRNPTQRFAHSTAEAQGDRALAAAPPDVDLGAEAPRRALVVACVVVGAWVLYGLLAPKPIGPSLARFFGAALPAPTATQLALIHPAAGEPIYLGDPLEIEAATRGRRVDAVWFERLPDPDDRVDDAPPLLRYGFELGGAASGSQSWRVTLAPHETAETMRYRIIAGDAVLSGVLELLPIPALMQARLSVTPPAYTKAAPLSTDAGAVRVWSGSRVEFAFTANTAVHDAVLVLQSESQESRVQMAVTTDEPRVARVTLPIRSGATYWYEFEDAWGRAALETPRRTLRVQADAPPMVRITTPARGDAPDDRFELSDAPRLVVKVRDDLALTDFALVLEAGGELTRRCLLPTRAEALKDYEIALATAEFGIEPGGQLRCWFEAADNHEQEDGRAAPQVGRSRTVTLTRSVERPALAPQPEEYLPESEGATGDTQAENGERVKREAASRGAAESGTDGESGKRADASGDGDRAGAWGRVEGDPEDAADVDGDPPPTAGDAAGVPREGEDPDGAAADGGAEENLSDGVREFARQFGAQARALAGQRDGGSEAESSPDQAGQGENADDEESTAKGPDDATSPEEQAADAADAAGDASEAAEDDAPDAASETTGDAGNESTAESSDEPPELSEPEAGTEESAAENDEDQQPAASQPATSQPSQAGDADDASSAATAPDEAESTRDPEPPDSASPDDGDAPSSAGRGGDSEGQSDSPNGEDQAPGAAAGGDDPSTDGPNASGSGGALGQPADTPPTAANPDGDADAPGADDVSAVLELLDRFGELRAADLDELGLSDEQRQQFIREFERLQKAATRAGVLGAVKTWSSRELLGSQEALRGGIGGAGVALDADGGAGYADDLPSIVAPREQNTPPELQAVLDAYYRSLAARRAAAANGNGAARESP